MKKPKPDLEAMVLQVQQQLTYLDKKIDGLIAQVGSAPRAPEPSSMARPAHAGRPEDRPQRTMYKAVCADCRKECEVPFKPSGERPVYCRECFARKKSGGGFKPTGGAAPQTGKHFYDRHVHRHHTAPEPKREPEPKPREKKRAVKPRKKRS